MGDQPAKQADVLAHYDCPGFLVPGCGTGPEVTLLGSSRQKEGYRGIPDRPWFLPTPLSDNAGSPLLKKSQKRPLILSSAIRLERYALEPTIHLAGR
jgi:hypothetical protein